MEEKFGKSARTLYIVTYSILIPVSLLLFVGLGAHFISAYAPDSLFVGVLLIALGVILGGASIGWLIYFIKMPQYTVTYKDGELNFRNKVKCTPLELDCFQQKGFGLDGAMFGFGKLIITVKGQNYKFNYVYNVSEVAKRLYTIKVEYAMKQEIAKRKLSDAQKIENVDGTVENNG